jgi:hypothetical protein
MAFTDIDYELEISKMSVKYSKLVDDLWSQLKSGDETYASAERRALSEGRKFGTREKASYLIYSSETMKHPELSLYRNLVEEGCFWHALDREEDLEYLFSTEEMQTAKKLVIETAARADRYKKNGFSAPGYSHPFFTVLQMHYEGKLRDVINEDLLAKITTRAFWEIMGYEPPLSQSYINSMRNFSSYFRVYLDLSSTGEVFEGSRRVSGYKWVSSGYIAAFEKAEPKLDFVNASKLALPIILFELERHITANNEPWNYYRDEEEYLSTVEINGSYVVREKYKKYLKDAEVQCALEEMAKKYLGLVLDDDGNIPVAEMLPNVLNLISWRSDEEKKNFVSRNVPKVSGFRDAEFLIYAADFPIDYFTSERASELKTLLRDGIPKMAVNTESKGKNRR